MAKTYQFQLKLNVDLDSHIRKSYPEIREYRTISKSLDARGAPKGRTPVFHYIIEALTSPEDSYSQLPSLKQYGPLPKKPIIIGAGPGGLFAAVRFAEHGVPCILLERGDEANRRMLKIAKYWRYGEMDEETNVCYGEGGAGLFSDGKLITRIKSNLVGYVMQKFVDFGAPEETAYVSNPHLGSNKIRGIITQIAKWLSERGTEIRYNTRVEELLYEGNRVVGVLLNNGEKLYSDHVILATGHSAKDIYFHLEKNQVAMKPKDFAVGVRVEHPRSYIDRLQHGEFCMNTELGAARYRLSWHDKSTDHGVYSFCMCPGGYVLSSGTEKIGIVVNGMSNYHRNSKWSNSALVVSVKAGEDFKADELMAGLKFQHDIEEKAYNLSRKLASGRELPAMRISEFLKGKLDNRELPKTSSPSGVFKADFREIFPQFILDHLRNGLHEFDKVMPGFISDDGILIAPETRTSAPITILRDKSTFESLSHKGLYPCGEGAGYAGGITSAAVDGVKIAISILEQIENKELGDKAPQLNYKGKL
ncbi:MAG TPA: NAD(P)/FAD-dependent oxidoreductase [Bacteriovoracaceae bacterium]|nr:NAD(P)/FAD-dependent oxidoreductase [Bacteriovoracaceae bacterium]